MISSPGLATRAEIEERLSAWNRDLHLASHNIVELMEDPDYQRLAAGGLGEATAKQVLPTLAELDELWRVLPALTAVIEDANARFAKLPWFKDEAALRDIATLLHGDSIAIATQTTYAERGLLTPDEVTRRLRPEGVLAAMASAYAAAKAVVMKVAETTTQLNARLDDLARDVPEPELVDARHAIAVDPLAPATAAAVDALVAARGIRVEVGATLAGAPARLAALEAAHAEATAVCAERRDKVTLVPEPPPPPERAVVDELVRWLDRLRETVARGKWQPARLGLANWAAQLDARIAACRDAAAANRRALDRRGELRGLLDGLKAKATNTGRIEDAEAIALYDRAHALLYARPTPVDEAERLVLAYGQAVR
jgi:hypothetical protein